MTYTVTVPGEPTGKGRPRVTKFGAYTPERTVLYENLVKTMAYQQLGPVPVLRGPLVLIVSAYFAIPKSASKKLQALMRRNADRPTKKPDTDNIAKICGDALNGIWYHDDSAIVEEHVLKWYADEPRVVITVEEWMRTD